MIDIQKIRRDTPGVKRLQHFNNAGAALPTQLTLDAIVNYLQEEAMTGGYRMQAKYQEAIETFYQRAGQLINASAEEIALTGNASQAFNQMLYSIPFEKGDVILTSDIEYGNSFVNYLQLKERRGVELRIIDSLPNGDFDLEALEKAIDNRVKLIAVTHIPTSSGIVMPVEAIGKIAKSHNILYLVDACQSIGQIPFDVEAVGCDFASATARKYLRGPRGLGFMYVRKAVINQLTPTFFDTVSATWQSKEKVQLNRSIRMFEDWEKSYALVMGFSEAIRYLLELGVENTWRRIQDLADYMRQELSKLPKVRVHDPGSQQCGIVTFTKEGQILETMHLQLKNENINTSINLPFNSLTDMERRGLRGTLRASVHYFNTKEEIDRLIEKVKNA